MQAVLIVAALAILVAAVTLLLGRPDERPKGTHLTMDEALPPAGK